MILVMKDVKGDESCHEISIGIYQHLTIGNGFLQSTQAIRTEAKFWGFDAQVDLLFKLHNLNCFVFFAPKNLILKTKQKRLYCVIKDEQA